MPLGPRPPNPCRCLCLCAVPRYVASILRPTPPDGMQKRKRRNPTNRRPPLRTHRARAKDSIDAPSSPFLLDSFFVCAGSLRFFSLGFVFAFGESRAHLSPLFFFVRPLLRPTREPPTTQSEPKEEVKKNGHRSGTRGDAD